MPKPPAIPIWGKRYTIGDDTPRRHNPIAKARDLYQTIMRMAPPDLKLWMASREGQLTAIIDAELAKRLDAQKARAGFAIVAGGAERGTVGNINEQQAVRALAAREGEGWEQTGLRTFEHDEAGVTFQIENGTLTIINSTDGDVLRTVDLSDWEGRIDALVRTLNSRTQMAKTMIETGLVDKAHAEPEPEPERIVTLEDAQLYTGWRQGVIARVPGGRDTEIRFYRLDSVDPQANTITFTRWNSEGTLEGTETKNWPDFERTARHWDTYRASNLLPGASEPPKGIRLNKLAEGGAGTNNAILKRLLKALAPSVKWSVKSSSGGGYSDIEGSGGTNADRKAGADALQRLGLSYGDGKLSAPVVKTYWTVIPQEWIPLATGGKAPADIQAAKEAAKVAQAEARAAAEADIEARSIPTDSVIPIGTLLVQLDRDNRIAVFEYGWKQITKRGEKKTVLKFDNIGQSSTMLRQRVFTAYKKGTVGSIPAPDMTPARVFGGRRTKAQGVPLIHRILRESGIEFDPTKPVLTSAGAPYGNWILLEGSAPWPGPIESKRGMSPEEQAAFFGDTTAEPAPKSPEIIELEALVAQADAEGDASYAAFGRGILRRAEGADVFEGVRGVKKATLDEINDAIASLNNWRGKPDAWIQRRRDELASLVATSDQATDHTTATGRKSKAQAQRDKRIGQLAHRAGTWAIAAKTDGGLGHNFGALNQTGQSLHEGANRLMHGKGLTHSAYQAIRTSLLSALDKLIEGEKPVPVGVRRSREVVEMSPSDAKALAGSDPFRAPHYSVGWNGLSTELAIAQGGVLYLDELDKFSPAVIDLLGDALRHQPYVLIAYRIGTDASPTGPIMGNLQALGVAVPGMPEPAAPAPAPATPGYAYKSVKAGDYAGSGSSAGFLRGLIQQAKRIENDKERDHFREQVAYALASRSITGEQGAKAYKAAGLTADGGFAMPEPSKAVQKEMRRAAAQREYEQVTDAAMRGSGLTKHTQRKAESARKETERLGGFKDTDQWAKPSDIPRDLAVRAFSGTSMSPERRANIVQREYAEAMNAMKATYPGQLAELEALKREYLQKMQAWLEAESRSTSWFVTGRSGRNERREQKKMDTAQRRQQELLAVIPRWEKRLQRDLKELAVVEAGGEAAVMRRKIERAKATQEAMKAANKIVKKKGLTDDAKIARMVDELGWREGTARKALEPDFAGRIGFPRYALTNNLANIKRMEKRLVELEAKERRQMEAAQGKVERETEYSFDADPAPSAGMVEYDFSDDRLRIHFDDKVRKRDVYELRGWRWSPSNTAWQRKLTDNAIASAMQITGLRLPYLEQI